MAPPAVTIFVTSLTSQPKVRQHTELLHRSLRGLEIPYEAFDLVDNQEAKTRWQRAKPPGQVIGLPGYLVGGEWVGTMDDFEYAVESQTLPSFLKQDQDHATTSTITKEEGGTVGEGELERLMREMSAADIDAFAAELGVENTGKVGLMVPEGSEPLPKGAEGDVENTQGDLESVGVKGTTQVVENPELGLEKKMAEVEVGGKVEPEVVSDNSLGAGVVDTLKKVEEAVVGTDDGVISGKEKID